MEWVVNNKHHRRLLCLVRVWCVASLMNATIASHAAGPIEPDIERKAENPLSKINTLIDANRFSDAISELQLLLESNSHNADTWNLLGYAERRLGNVKNSGAAYAKALKINPQHKGALAYQAELFFSQGRKQAAQRNRVKLAKLCPTGCVELTDLDAFLQRSKFNNSDRYK